MTYLDNITKVSDLSYHFRLQIACLRLYNFLYVWRKALLLVQVAA